MTNDEILLATSRRDEVDTANGSNQGGREDPRISKPILLIGPRVGKTVTGVAVAFEMLAEYLCSLDGRVLQVNMTQKGNLVSAGTWKLRRTLFVAAKVIEAWLKLPFVTTVYVIVSTSALGFLKDLLIITVAHWLRRKVVIHLHGGGYRSFYEASPPFGQRLIRSMLRKTDRIIVLGELLRSQFEFLNCPEKIVVVPNGLPPDGDADSVRPKQHPGDQQPWRILYLSNLMESKGYVHLMDACRLLAETTDTPFQIDFCGDFVHTVSEETVNENPKEIFLDRIEREPDSEFTRYHGIVYGSDKVRFLRECHLFVLPTSYPWEGQPLSIIEAMACGTPVISTRHAGIPEQVENGVTGWLIPASPVTVDALHEALQTALTLSPQEYEEMSDRAIRRYHDCFSRNRHLSNMLQVLNSVADG